MSIYNCFKIVSKMLITCTSLSFGYTPTNSPTFEYYDLSQYGAYIETIIIGLASVG